MILSKIDVISGALALAFVGQNIAMSLYWKAIRDQGPDWPNYARATKAIQVIWPLSVSVTLIAIVALWILAKTATPSLTAPLASRA